MNTGEAVDNITVYYPIIQKWTRSIKGIIGFSQSNEVVFKPKYASTNDSIFIAFGAAIIIGDYDELFFANYQASYQQVA